VSAEIDLRAMIEAGELERVDPDPATAAVELADARTHLSSAEKLVGDDPIMAYSAVYDATRKALAAHMRARGYRVRGKVGHHAKTIRYGRVALEGQGINEVLERLDDMRIVRNDAEYSGRRIGRQEVAADLETARSVVGVIQAELEGGS
jgi:hypothetical protein